jgi:hypothetical protein
VENEMSDPQSKADWEDARHAWLSENGRKGGQKSRRKLTKKQARDMVKARELKRAVGVALKPCERDGARSTTVRLSDDAP